MIDALKFEKLLKCPEIFTAEKMFRVIEEEEILDENY